MRGVSPRAARHCLCPGTVRRQLGSSACSQDGRTSTARTPRSVQGPGQPGGLPGGGVNPDARAPGPVLGLDSPRPAWPYALSGSCNIGRFLSWTRMVPSTATMWCIVLRSDAATGGPQAAPTQTWPLPPGRRLGLGLPLGPSRSLKWTRGRAPGTDPRAAGPCAGMAMTASGCTTRPARARPAGVKIFQARQLVCSHHREPTLIHITDLFPTVLLSHLVSGQLFFCTASAPNITHTPCCYIQLNQTCWPHPCCLLRPISQPCPHILLVHPFTHPFYTHAWLSS